jgi:hypothetical protein
LPGLKEADEVFALLLAGNARLNYRFLSDTGWLQAGSDEMQGEISDDAKLAAKRLRPLVVVVVTAKLVVSVLLLATVHYSPPASEIVALR